MKEYNSFGVVYVHINKENGMPYVGQTCQSLKRRFRKGDITHNSYKNCVLLYRALKKYTWDSFITIILKECTSQEELDKWENHYIEQYKSAYPGGYNLTNSANGKVVFTDEVIQKISESRKALFKKSPWDMPAGMTKRRTHIFVGGIESKLCSICKKVKSLENYSLYATAWDGLQRSCKICSRASVAASMAKNPRTTLTTEELSESYKRRGEMFKTPHTYVDDIECKLCSRCNKNLPLTAYGNLKRSPDGLDGYCKSCKKERYSERKALEIPLTDEERILAERKTSRNRTEAQKARFVGNKGDVLKDKYRAMYAKPVIGVHANGSIIEFASGREATKAGFCRVSISSAIKTGKAYKGYSWSFKT